MDHRQCRYLTQKYVYNDCPEWGLADLDSGQAPAVDDDGLFGYNRNGTVGKSGQPNEQQPWRKFIVIHRFRKLKVVFLRAVRPSEPSDLIMVDGVLR
jgi:hypothetical protein